MMLATYYQSYVMMCLQTRSLRTEEERSGCEKQFGHIRLIPLAKSEQHAVIA